MLPSSVFSIVEGCHAPNRTGFLELRRGLRVKKSRADTLQQVSLVRPVEPLVPLVGTVCLRHTPSQRFLKMIRARSESREVWVLMFSLLLVSAGSTGTQKRTREERTSYDGAKNVTESDEES